MPASLWHCISVSDLIKYFVCLIGILDTISIVFMQYCVQVISTFYLYLLAMYLFLPVQEQSFIT